MQRLKSCSCQDWLSWLFCVLDCTHGFLPPTSRAVCAGIALQSFFSPSSSTLPTICPGNPSALSRWLERFNSLFSLQGLDIQSIILFPCLMSQVQKQVPTCFELSSRSAAALSSVECLCPWWRRCCCCLCDRASSTGTAPTSIHLQASTSLTMTPGATGRPLVSLGLLDQLYYGHNYVLQWQFNLVAHICMFAPLQFLCILLWCSKSAFIVLKLC